MNQKGNRHQEYLKNLRAEKWVVVRGRMNGNCEHPVRDNLTCGEYKGAVLLVPASGKSIKVPEGYVQRSELWVCSAHLSDYEN